MSTKSDRAAMHYEPKTFRGRAELIDHVRASLDGYLPDPSVIGPEEEPHEAARALVAFCEGEASKIGETLDRVAIEHLDEYREAVVIGLAARIISAREVAS